MAHTDRISTHGHPDRLALPYDSYAAFADVYSTAATIRQALLGLPDDAAKGRVWRWAGDVIGMNQPVSPSSAGGSPTSGDSVADLIDRAQPENRSDRILVVASWLEASTGGTDWTSQALNDELKQLGEGVPNITDALSALIAKKPSLVRQTRKTGRLLHQWRPRMIWEVVDDARR